MDAAVFEPVPVISAIADGCTHVLVLCSRPPSAERGKKKGTMARMAKKARGGVLEQREGHRDTDRDRVLKQGKMDDREDKRQGLGGKEGFEERGSLRQGEGQGFRYRVKGGMDG